VKEFPAGNFIKMTAKSKNFEGSSENKTGGKDRPFG
jgi:hypothetical protein